MPSSWWSAAVVAACGCNLASGLDDFDVATPSTGGAAGAPVGGAAGSDPCAAVPRDDFGDGALAEQWSLAMGASYIVESNGVLSLTVPAGVSDWWGLVTSAAPHVLEGCGSFVEHHGELPAGGASSFFLTDAAGNRIGFLRVADALRCQYRVAGFENVNVVEVPYDPVAHRWLWVAPNGDATEWHASSDGKDWALLASADSVVDAAALELRLSAGALPSVVSSGFTVVFDNVNVSADAR